jgi:hypothetical protein
MAKYLLTYSTSRITGSRKGCTFQRAGNVFVIRHRMVPVQKRTEKQQAVKNIFDSVAKRWRTLSPGEQDSFINKSPQYPRVNSLGVPYNLTGWALQQSSNQSLVLSGFTPIDTMPDAPVFPIFSISIFSLNIAGSALAFQLNPLVVPVGFSAVVHMSAATEVPAESSQYKFIASLPAGTNTPTINLYSEYVSIFGSVQNLSGLRFNCRVQMLDIASGQLSLPQFRSGAIA